MCVCVCSLSPKFWVRCRNDNSKCWGLEIRNKSIESIHHFWLPFLSPWAPNSIDLPAEFWRRMDWQTGSSNVTCEFEQFDWSPMILKPMEAKTGDFESAYVMPIERGVERNEFSVKFSLETRRRSPKSVRTQLVLFRSLRYSRSSQKWGTILTFGVDIRRKRARKYGILFWQIDK